jgi:hypothetical protein
MWDRRKGDRRVMVQEVSLERRRRQRRAEPDSMWYTHGFTVVERTEPLEAEPGDTGVAAVTGITGVA